MRFHCLSAGMCTALTIDPISSEVTSKTCDFSQMFLAPLFLSFLVTTKDQLTCRADRDLLLAALFRCTCFCVIYFKREVCCFPIFSP